MNLSDKRILVTGGSGFVGSFLCKKLADRGCQHVLVPRRSVASGFPPFRKYNLIDTPIRSVKAILKAEEEFHDRIWYDRNLFLQERVKEGKEVINPDIKKGALKAMKSVEGKYGGKKALREYYKDDFEWGMMNGKLSALRWVLGDEWDMLDT